MAKHGGPATDPLGDSVRRESRRSLARASVKSMHGMNQRGVVVAPDLPLNARSHQLDASNPDLFTPVILSQKRSNTRRY